MSTVLGWPGGSAPLFYLSKSIRVPPNCAKSGKRVQQGINHRALIAIISNVSWNVSLDSVFKSH